MEYQRYIRNRQIERAKKLLINLDPDTYKKGPNDVTRFIKRTSSTKSGEEVSEQYAINFDLIASEEKYDGFYAVATNLDDACFASAYTDSKVLSDLETLFDLNLNKKFYLPKNLNKIIRQIS